MALHRKNSVAAGRGPIPGAAHLPAGPTLQLDDENINASQLYAAADASAYASHGVRPRARLVVPPQQVEEALQLTTQGKVTMRNAWAVRLIEGMATSLGSCLDEEADEYAQFTRAAQLVEGGAKVWTHRVDSTYLLSTQMVKRLLRNDGSVKDGDDDEGQGGDGQGGGDGAAANTRRRRKPLERTIADSLDEINADGSQTLVAARLAQLHQARQRGDVVAPPSAVGHKGAVAANGALFRAVTEKFDQGHAQGLLLNNTRFGAGGNLVLDRDFASEVLPPPATGGEGEEEPIPALETRNDDGDAAPLVIGSRALPAVDVDVPVFNLRSGARIGDAKLADAERNLATEINNAAGGDDVDDAGDADWEAVTIPNTSRAPSVFSRPVSDSEDDAAGGAWAGDDGDADAGDDDAADHGTVVDETAFARDLVAGTAQLDALDAQFSAVGGGATTSSGSTTTGALGMATMVAALAAEDPTSWVPLSRSAPTSGLQPGRPRGGVLASLRTQATQQHRLQGDVLEDPMRALKRTRREKRSVQFIGVGATCTGGDATDGKGAEGGRGLLDTSSAALEVDPALLAEARTRNATLLPLGKKLLGTTTADATAAQYTNGEYGLQRAVAQHLVLPPQLRDPLPSWCGTSETSHVPMVEDFFQLFNAPAAHWNLLKKTVRHTGESALRAEHLAAMANNTAAAMPLVRDSDDDAGGAGDYDDYAAGGDDTDDHWGASGIAAPAMPTEPLIEELVELCAAQAAEGQSDGGLELISTPDLVKTLKVQTATAPTMVDVVRLRSTMWRRAAALAARAQQQQQPVPVKPEEGTPAATTTTTGRTLFSDVIATMLPDVPSIAKDGTLSPAFFFFSLLFLANEHGLDLRQVVGEEELAAVMRGEDPKGDALQQREDDDDDAPLVPRGASSSTTDMRRAHRQHVGGKVSRVGVDVVIRIPMQSNNTTTR